MKNIDLKVINNISKDKNNGIDIFDEIIQFKIKSKFYYNKKKYWTRYITSIKY